MMYRKGVVIMFKLMLRLLKGLLYRFSLHVEDRSVFPKALKPDEEAELFQRYAQGDSSAKEKLILHNLRLVAHIVKKYQPSPDMQEELISIGTIGLIKAVTTFDPCKGNRFAAYGSRCVENEILMHYRREKKTQKDVYFDEPIDTDKDGNQLTLGDIIASTEDLCSQADMHMDIARLAQGLETLDEREREIIFLRYGIGGRKPLTQRETAKLLGISRSYVSRIEKHAIERLGEYFKG